MKPKPSNDRGAWKRSARNASRRTNLTAESLETRSMMASNVAAAPWVQAVQLPRAGTFGTGQAVTFVLKFNERVNVDPDAVIPMEVGIARRQAEYVAGSGTRSIVFRMRVTDNDIDTDGIRLGQLDSNTGKYDFDFGNSITDADGNLASKAIPRVRTGGLRVDGTGPNIASISELKVQGNRVSLLVRLDRPVFLNAGQANLPYVPATIDGQAVELKVVPHGRVSGGRVALGRLLKFEFKAASDLNGADIRLTNEMFRAIEMPSSDAIQDGFGNDFDYDQTRTGNLVIDDRHGPIQVNSGTSVHITETGKVVGDLLVEKGVVFGEGDIISVVNDGIVDTVLGNNAAAIRIDGNFSKVVNNGELRLGGNNSPGIEIRGDDAIVENNGYIHSEAVGLSGASVEPGRELGNDEGISVDGHRAKVTVTGRFEGRAGNAEYVSLSGDDVTLIAAASAETFGVQSEIFSISGLKSSDPAKNFTANVQGVYKTHESESEFISVTAIGGKLNVNATFESLGFGSEGVSITGGGITSTIAGSIATHGEKSEGISISPLPPNANKPPVPGSGVNLNTTVSATITTEGRDSEGISLTGDDSQLNFSGQITTNGRNSEGISITGNGLELKMTGGSIVTTGLNSEGISITGKGVSLTSAEIGGEVRTSGDDAEGISLTGISVVSTLTGQVVTTGIGSEGVSVIGDNLFVQIDGSILTSGNGSPGIAILGNNITVVINGTIATTGTQSPAILVSGGSNITIDCGPNASITAANSVVFANPTGVHVNGECPWIA